jgi:hypothetical protein
MLHDAFTPLALESEPEYIVTRDILYADDTLLVSKHISNLHVMLEAIILEGQKYGMEMNWDKTVQIQVGCADTIRMPTGEPVKNVRDAVYLGGIVSCDGRAKHELSRRIGESTNTFKQLQKLWAHAAIGKNRQLYIYPIASILFRFLVASQGGQRSFRRFSLQVLTTNHGYPAFVLFAHF